MKCNICNSKKNLVKGKDNKTEKEFCFCVDCGLMIYGFISNIRNNKLFDKRKNAICKLELYYKEQR